MKTNRRAQAPKRIDRHSSHLADKGRYSNKGQKSPRYNRPKDGNWQA